LSKGASASADGILTVESSLSHRAKDKEELEAYENYGLCT